MCIQTSAHRVASISAIEGGIRGRTRSGSIRECLTRRLSALSASSLVSLAGGVGGLNDVRQRHLEKKDRDRQADKEINEKKVEEKEEEEQELTE